MAIIVAGATTVAAVVYESNIAVTSVRTGARVAAVAASVVVVVGNIFAVVARDQRT